MSNGGNIMTAKRTFIFALKIMEEGKIVRRKMWDNGSARFLKLNSSKDGFILRMKGGANIPWSPSNADIFADDWELI